MQLFFLTLRQKATEKKFEIGVNICQGRSGWCTSFLFIRLHRTLWMLRWTTA